MWFPFLVLLSPLCACGGERLAYKILARCCCCRRAPREKVDPEDEATHALVSEWTRERRRFLLMHLCQFWAVCLLLLYVPSLVPPCQRMGQASLFTPLFFSLCLALALHWKLSRLLPIPTTGTTHVYQDVRVLSVPDIAEAPAAPARASSPSQAQHPAPHFSHHVLDLHAYEDDDPPENDMDALLEIELTPRSLQDEVMMQVPAEDDSAPFDFSFSDRGEVKRAVPDSESKTFIDHETTIFEKKTTLGEDAEQAIPKQTVAKQKDPQTVAKQKDPQTVANQKNSQVVGKQTDPQRDNKQQEHESHANQEQIRLFLSGAREQGFCGPLSLISVRWSFLWLCLILGYILSLQFYASVIVYDGVSFHIPSVLPRFAPLSRLQSTRFGPSFFDCGCFQPLSTVSEPTADPASHFLDLDHSAVWQVQCLSGQGFRIRQPVTRLPLALSSSLPLALSSSLPLALSSSLPLAPSSSLYTVYTALSSSLNSASTAAADFRFPDGASQVLQLPFATLLFANHTFLNVTRGIAALYEDSLQMGASLQIYALISASQGGLYTLQLHSNISSLDSGSTEEGELLFWQLEQGENLRHVVFPLHSKKRNLPRQQARVFYLTLALFENGNKTAFQEDLPATHFSWTLRFEPLVDGDASSSSSTLLRLFNSQLFFFWLTIVLLASFIIVIITKTCVCHLRRLFDPRGYPVCG